MKKDFGKVAVLMGGNSAEREVSLKSGQAILEALLRQGVDALGIDTAHDIVAQLTKTQIDRVFIALHGRGGEDGTIQGLLEHLGLPYTGSGVLGSALAMDKYRTKQLWQGLGLPTPASVPLQADSDFNQVVAQVGLPLMVKPVLEGSSVGISKVTTVNELAQAVETALEFDCLVIAEHFVSGIEYTAAILQETVFPLIRLETPRDFYDFTAKYSDNKTSYICPCGLPAEQEQALQNIAKQAFLSIGAGGWGRVDFIVDSAGQAWLLEVNTIPGMTDHSLVPKAAQVAGINFDELILRILEIELFKK
ncbi:D-alanine--D-alanine ligase [Candidatus Thiomargarita nelsonii]|uniref:D-alanine--D-alanine ligase n=1 Tax=Candidatus Thiomargarita nelsonii TaxID=1003181 RepID=A0A0A6PK82_9GAMM|nr:D-alanine--D-alanine ligase [Candidatus Thiomargarita nelsonii]